MWIKICGVTRTEDAAAVADSGADAIGFNFYSNSKRYVSIPTACALADAARRSSTDAPCIDLVGVFVNAEPDAVRMAVHEVGLNAIQVHGNETAEHIAAIHRLCPDIPIVRAIRVNANEVERTLNDLDLLSAAVSLNAILLDTFVPGEFGGTGVTLNHSILERCAQHLNRPLILAGGLTSQNVALAIDRLKIWGIDTASGVESAPGIKDSTRILEFVRSARAATLSSDGRSDSVRISELSLKPTNPQIAAPYVKRTIKR